MADNYQNLKSACCDILENLKNKNGTYIFRNDVLRENWSEVVWKLSDLINVKYGDEGYDVYVGQIKQIADDWGVNYGNFYGVGLWYSFFMELDNFNILTLCNDSRFQSLFRWGSLWSIYIDRLIIPKEVKTLRNFPAFSCKKPCKVEFEEGSTVTYLPSGYLWPFFQLKELIIPDSIDRIGSKNFKKDWTDLKIYIRSTSGKPWQVTINDTDEVIEFFKDHVINK